MIGTSGYEQHSFLLTHYTNEYTDIHVRARCQPLIPTVFTKHTVTKTVGRHICAYIYGDVVRTHAKGKVQANLVASFPVSQLSSLAVSKAGAVRAWE